MKIEIYLVSLKSIFSNIDCQNEDTNRFQFNEENDEFATLSKILDSSDSAEPKLPLKRNE